MKNTKFLIFSALFLTSLSILTYGMEQDFYAMKQALKHEHKEILKTLVIKQQYPNEICVPMWGSNSITSSPTMKSPLIISTGGLNGCLATALHIKYSNGDQYAGITHYPSLSFNDQKEDIKMSCLQALKAQNETKKIIATNFFFHSPKENTNPIRNDTHYKVLRCVINIELKETGTIKTNKIPYDMFSFEDNRDLEVIFPAIELKADGSITTNDAPYDMFSFEDNQDQRDLEVILYPDKATIKINNEIIDL
jgi:hypothetical protein